MPSGFIEVYDVIMTVLGSTAMSASDLKFNFSKLLGGLGVRGR